MKLEDIKERVLIASNGQYVVLYGLRFWIFKTDGTFIACRSDLRHVSAVLFLPNNKVFVDGGKNSYHIVSLENGSEIWNCARPTPMEYTAMKLVASKDYRYIYTFYEWNEKFYLVSIDLQQRKLYVQQDPDLKHATLDIACDESDRPCLLKTVYVDASGVRISDNAIELFENGAPSKSRPNWKHKWQYQGSEMAFRFFNGTNCVITQHLMVHDLECNEVYYILENENDWMPPTHAPSDCWTDVTGRYLVLKFTDANVVVDIKCRTVAAVYPGKFFWGCLIGNEYWMSIGHGVERRAFPSARPLM